MKKQERSSFKLVWIFGLIIISVVLAKKEWRTKLLAELKHARESTEQAVEFIKENREQIVDQVRTTATEISTVVRDITSDVKKLSETASHLKDSSEEIMKATKEAADGMRNLKQSLPSSEVESKQ